MGSVAYKTSDYLNTPEDIAAYIEAAMEDGDERVILLALREAADSIGGMAELARRAGLTREAVYKALGPKGNPHFSSLLAILHAFGLGLGVTFRKGIKGSASLICDQKSGIFGECLGCPESVSPVNPCI